jgi:hypothetical protein
LARGAKRLNSLRAAARWPRRDGGDPTPTATRQASHHSQKVKMLRRTGNSDLRQLCNYGRVIFSWATAEMNNYTLAKLVVLTIVLILAIARRRPSQRMQGKLSHRCFRATTLSAMGNGICREKARAHTGLPRSTQRLSQSPRDAVAQFSGQRRYCQRHFRGHFDRRSKTRRCEGPASRLTSRPTIAQGMPSLAIASCYLSMRVLFEDGSTTLGDTVSRGLSIFRHGCRMDGFAFASDCSG